MPCPTPARLGSFNGSGKRWTYAQGGGSGVVKDQEDSAKFWPFNPPCLVLFLTSRALCSRKIILEERPWTVMEQPRPIRSLAPTYKKADLPVQNGEEMASLDDLGGGCAKTVSPNSLSDEEIRKQRWQEEKGQTRDGSGGASKGAAPPSNRRAFVLHVFCVCILHLHWPIVRAHCHAPPATTSFARLEAFFSTTPAGFASPCPPPPRSIVPTRSPVKASHTAALLHCCSAALLVLRCCCARGRWGCTPSQWLCAPYRSAARLARAALGPAPATVYHRLAWPWPRPL